MENKFSVSQHLKIAVKSCISEDAISHIL